MKRILVLIFIVTLSLLVWIFYYYRFFQGFSDEVYRDFIVAQNFLEKRKFLTQELFLPEVIIYEKFGFLFHKDWPNLSRGPLLGISLALVSYFFGISLEYSFLFLLLSLFIGWAILSYKFFQKFLPLSLSILGSFLLMTNFFLLEMLFRQPVLVINLLIFSLILYLLVGKLKMSNIILLGLISGINYYNSNLSLLFFLFIFFYLYWRKGRFKKERLVVLSIVFFIVITPFLYFRYKLTANPFFSSSSAFTFLSFTQSFPGEELKHYLREVNIKDFFQAHPREVAVKFINQLQQGVNEFAGVTSNYLLFTLGLCGFFYNFKRVAGRVYRRLQKIHCLKLLLGFSLPGYFFFLAFWKMEAQYFLIFLLFIVLFGLVFIFCETRRRAGSFKSIYFFIFLIALLVFNLYPFLFKEKKGRIKEEEITFTPPLLDESIVNIGPPRLAYQTGMKVVALPLQLEDLEEEHLRVYSIYLRKDVLDNSKILRYKGWSKVLQEKKLTGFKLIREFGNGDLYFVAQSAF